MSLASFSHEEQTMLFSFQEALKLPSEKWRSLFGNKGAGLLKLIQVGADVPDGFFLSSDLFRQVQPHSFDLYSVIPMLQESYRALEERSRLSLSRDDRPFLVSVRSSGVTSMPGMMDTILNIGMTSDIFKKQNLHHPSFAQDLYLRFLSSYGRDVLKIKPALDANLPIMQKVEAYLQEMQPYPEWENPLMQLQNSVQMVFQSFYNERALQYRELSGISKTEGIAVIVQNMVFGNYNSKSCTGVFFTRNPSSGESALFGEYIPMAQGEDLVSGIKTPVDIAIGPESLAQRFPAIFQQICDLSRQLENHLGDMQDVEFTVENDVLYILQTRDGKRTSVASLKIQHDFVKEKRSTKAQALQKVSAEDLKQVLYSFVDDSFLEKHPVLARGLATSPGAVVGALAFSAESVLKKAALGQSVIFVRPFMSPEDIAAMKASAALVTSCGGMTSHAAVIARGMGIPCVTAVENMHLLPSRKEVVFNGRHFKAGDVITVDGHQGRLFAGHVPLKNPMPSAEFQTVMSWAQEVSPIEVWTNAESVAEMTMAFHLGAKGVGLCRTEHMFFEESKMGALYQLMISHTPVILDQALEKIQNFQRKDFIPLMRCAGGRPLTLRLLDPPLHEFLPHTKEQMTKIAADFALGLDQVIERFDRLKEVNPMMGNRGCRLGITFPGLYEAQVLAMAEAALEVVSEPVALGGSALQDEVESELTVHLNILIPFVGFVKEFAYLKERLERVFQNRVCKNRKIQCFWGTMVELPSAALCIEQLATQVDFLSFGTNDLTQMVLGLSRDDSTALIEDYLQKGILPSNPFISIEKSSVAPFIHTTCARAKMCAPHVKVSICGEHAGDPESIALFQKCQIDTLSCSAFRIPCAQLALAQRVLEGQKSDMSTLS
jgi:pyruvate, orthophosphate dikinase